MFSNSFSVIDFSCSFISDSARKGDISSTLTAKSCKHGNELNNIEKLDKCHGEFIVKVGNLIKSPKNCYFHLDFVCYQYQRYEKYSKCGVSKVCLLKFC